MTDPKTFMRRAIALSRQNLETMAGGPFGSVVVKDGQIVGEGRNDVLATNDPTAHAEIVAIRDAARRLGTFDLTGCEIYTSCEPCPMCLAAIYWARLDRIYYACSRQDAAHAGFDDEFIYAQFGLDLPQRSLPMVQLGCAAADDLFQEWIAKPDKVPY